MNIYKYCRAGKRDYNLLELTGVDVKKKTSKPLGALIAVFGPLQVFLPQFIK
jgi:hypothetical protein